MNWTAVAAVSSLLAGLAGVISAVAALIIALRRKNGNGNGK